MTETNTNSIDFWFSVGSTYTYLSVMRLDKVAKSNGVTFNWHPFNVRTIMAEVGNRPFSGKPVKMQYMWRDIERRAQKYCLKPRIPAPYPLPELDRANLVAAVGYKEGWCSDYVKATYRRWFEEGLEPGTSDQLQQVLQEVGQLPERVVEAAEMEEVKTILDDNTSRARELGIFGSPCFVVGSELFWGDDRLEDAVAWMKTGTLTE